MNQTNQQLDYQIAGWEYVNCFCAGGTNYNGYECGICAGWGAYYKHIKSGVLAQYPGGPFLGRESKEYYEHSQHTNND